MGNFRTQPIVLVDMDGVLVDYLGRFYALAEQIAGDPARLSFLPARDNVDRFYLEGYARTPEQLSLLNATMLHPELFANLDLIDGAAEALNEIGKEFPTFIVTSPSLTNPFCVPSKIDQVRRCFGKRWLNRLIFTADKTVVTGTVLIDDKPNIDGHMIGAQKTWQQIIFDQPYNRDVPGPRLTTWGDWPARFAELGLR